MFLLKDKYFQFGCLVAAEWILLKQIIPPELLLSFIVYSVSALLIVFPVLKYDLELEDFLT